MNPKSLIIIGGGVGGYAAALEAIRRKIAVTLIERQEIGGTCTNRGCIPSKFFLSKSKLYSEIPRLGSSSPASFPAMASLLAKKNEIVGTLRQRMEQALKSSGVERVEGTARFVSKNKVEVGPAGSSSRTLEAEAIVLATGSSPVKPALFPDHPAILDSAAILNIDYVPSHLVVVGGGYIGCELACAFQGLGSKVTLIEKERRLLPTQPEFEASATVLHRSFEKRGMTVWLGTEITSVEPLETRRVRGHCSNGETFEANAFLLAIGRSPNLKDLNLESAGLALNQGRLSVNALMQTTVPSIYAIGDLVSPLPLAHVATREAEVAIAHLSGESKAIDYSAIPRCIYTWPEAAAVGLSEMQAQQAGFTPRVDRYHFAASAKALIEEETEGLWIIVSDATTRKILGGQIVGPHATELIHLISLSLKAGLRIDDIADTVFAHPSLSEGFQEAMSRAVKTQSSPSKKR